MIYKDYPEDFENLYHSLAISTDFFGDMEKKDMLYTIYQEKGREQLITFLKSWAELQESIRQSQIAIEKSRVDAERARLEEKLNRIARIIAGVEYLLGFLLFVFNRNILLLAGGGLLLVGNRLLEGSIKSDRNRHITTIFTIGLVGFALFLNSRFLGPLPPIEPEPLQGTRFPVEVSGFGNYYIAQLHPVIILAAGIPVGLLITLMICFAWEWLMNAFLERTRLDENRMRMYIFYVLLMTFNAVWTSSLTIETPEEMEENYFWQIFLLPTIIGFIASLFVINLWDGPAITMATGAAAILVGLINFFALPHLMKFVRMLFEPFHSAYR